MWRFRSLTQSSMRDKIHADDMKEFEQMRLSDEDDDESKCGSLGAICKLSLLFAS